MYGQYGQQGCGGCWGGAGSASPARSPQMGQPQAGCQSMDRGDHARQQEALKEALRQQQAAGGARPGQVGGRSPAQSGAGGGGGDKNVDKLSFRAPIDWSAMAGEFPIGQDEDDKRERSKLFNLMDPNGNGYLSLAEVDKGVRDVLCCDEIFDCKPVIMRAFQTAKNAAKTKARLGADYVERVEFRLLLVYLRKYFELFKLFRGIDKSNDRKISIEARAPATVARAHAPLIS